MRQRQAQTLLGRSVIRWTFLRNAPLTSPPLCFQFDPVIAEEYRITDGNYSLKWIDDLKQLLPKQTYFVANELFDAYPIHKFQVRANRSDRSRLTCLLCIENRARLERSRDRLGSPDETIAVCSVSRANDDESIVRERMLTVNADKGFDRAFD